MSVNKVILVGHLGKDPELRYTPGGDAVCSFSLATTEKWKNKQGEKQEKTEWHNLIFWRATAEICAKYLKKGSQIYVEGRIQTRDYDDRDGVKKYITEIVGDKMQMLGSPPDRQGPGQDNRSQASSQSQEPPFNPDDDIPF